MARAMRSFSPPAPAPTTNSTLPVGFHAAAADWARAAPAPLRAASSKAIAAETWYVFILALQPRSVLFARKEIIDARLSKSIRSGLTTVSRPSTQKRSVGVKPDRGAGLDLRDVFAQFGQAVGFSERGEDAGAVLRIFLRLDGAVRRGAQFDADI